MEGEAAGDFVAAKKKTWQLNADVRFAVQTPQKPPSARAVSRLRTFFPVLMTSARQAHSPSLRGRALRTLGGLLSESEGAAQLKPGNEEEMRVEKAAPPDTLRSPGRAAKRATEGGAGRGRV